MGGESCGCYFVHSRTSKRASSVAFTKRRSILQAKPQSVHVRSYFSTGTSISAVSRTARLQQGVVVRMVKQGSVVMVAVVRGYSVVLYCSTNMTHGAAECQQAIGKIAK